MKVAEIALRQEIRQMLNEAGINKNTLKEMAKSVLDEEIERAVKQAINEKDFDGKVSQVMDKSLDRRVNGVIRDEVRNRVMGIFHRMSITVTVEDDKGSTSTTV